VTAEVIEGEVREVRETALAVLPQQPMGLARSVEPEEIVVLATRMANALSRIVEGQKLYATINGKRYPTVEAWMTVGRFDNVVVQEESVTRRDDGSYEAFVRLVRLTDMETVGRASAVCGMSDDKPWSSRAEYARRSMAVTRASSRAFREQYSWIMALAGYEPTPAEEMPRDEAEGRGQHPAQRQPAREVHHPPRDYTGTVEVEDGDFEPRQYAQGWAVLFHLNDGNGIGRVIWVSPAAKDLTPFANGAQVVATGEWSDKQNAVVATKVALAPTSEGLADAALPETPEL
jgi:hypothetical protein